MKFLYSKTSIKYLKKLERGVVRKIIEAIEKLPFEGDINKLKGKKYFSPENRKISSYLFL